VPIESPQLDDLRFGIVVDQLRRQIPVYAPEWTDHNESDPGIALLQLFGYLSEQIGYRLNRLPDKAYVEMLKLVGVRLRPAEAARTTLAFYLAKAETASAFLIPDGAKVRARSKATPPPTFETTLAVDGVPAQAVAVVTTLHDDLRDLLATDVNADSATAAMVVPPRFSLVWDGRQPKLKDWPEQPVRLFARPSEEQHLNLWLAIAFNPLPSAGFLGQRVTLTIQLDDDEQPDGQAFADCSAGLDPLAESIGPAVELVYYRPAQPGYPAGSWQPVRMIADSTFGLTRSGQIRFDVPTTIGPVPDGEWKDVRTPPPVTVADLCAAAASATGSIDLPTLIPHPLVGALKTPVLGMPAKVPVSGWLGLRFAEARAPLALRAVTFNAAPAVAAVTAANELVGRGNNRSDQVKQLAHGNVLGGSLELIVQDVVRDVYERWTQVPDLDTAGPDDRVYVLDAEAGLLYFGDGVHGRVPGLDARIVAVRYRWGGGGSSELAAGTITQGETLPSQIQDVTNPVPARGGRNAETLDEAKRRAPRELKTLGRAVTADDFELLAGQTPGVRVARAVVVPLRRPYTAEGLERPGIDVARVAPGAVSIVIVPDGAGRFLAPTEGMLQTVCRHLDRYRLITTELYVVAPQYVRIFNMTVTVVPRPGQTRTQLREAIAARLETYLHVLTGGPDGTGYPFGGTLYHAELVAQIFRVEGVDRVEDVTAQYDGTAPDAVPPMVWRDERQDARNLVGCPSTAADDDRIALFPDENVFVDTASLNVIVQA
jgi:predicted phage baseplate assembly protein